MQTWYPPARRNVASRDGGAYIAVPWRGVMHTTESMTFTPGRSYFGHHSWPHFTVTRAGIVYQHIPIHRAARALARPRGSGDTNRARAIQTEVVGRSADTNWPLPQRDALRGLIGWVRAQTGITTDVVPPGPIPGSARANAPQRMSSGEWFAFNGWCSHRHVPWNHHWDTGAFDLSMLMTQEEEMDVLELGDVGGEVVVLCWRLNQLLHGGETDPRGAGEGYGLPVSNVFNAEVELYVRHVQAEFGFTKHPGKATSFLMDRIQDILIQRGVIRSSGS